MPYVMEEMTKEAEEKIERDFSANPESLKTLKRIRTKFSTRFPIDRDKNFYLFYAFMEIGFAQDGFRPCVFFFNGTAYAVRVYEVSDGKLGGNSVEKGFSCFEWRTPVPPDEEMAEFVREFTDAFLTYSPFDCHFIQPVFSDPLRVQREYADWDKQQTRRCDMPYLMEEMTKEVEEKIKRDFSANPESLKTLKRIRTKYSTEFPIDRDKNFYLFKVYIEIGDMQHGFSSYAFFFNGTAYAVRVYEGSDGLRKLRGNPVEAGFSCFEWHTPVPPDDEMEEFVREFTYAYLTYLPYVYKPVFSDPLRLQREYADWDKE